jgi:plasmid stabilization system protein ParE
MALRVKISARAALHTRRAAEWWLKNRPAAPGAVAKDIGEAIALLAEQPGIGAKYEGARTPGVRRLYLGRIGYFLYYRVKEEALEVLALWHSSRGEQPRV